MKNKIIIVGKAASGKDFFKKYLLTQGYVASTSHTTRPMREGETQQKEYFFIDRKAFKNLIKQDMLFEYKEFNGWLYGTSNNQMKNSDVFIFTPSGIKSLPQSFKKLCVIVYLDIDQDTRVERLRERSDSDSIERRILADRKDFEGFKDFNIHVKGSVFDPEYTLRKILYYKDK